MLRILLKYISAHFTDVYNFLSRDSAVSFFYIFLPDDGGTIWNHLEPNMLKYNYCPLVAVLFFFRYTCFLPELKTFS